MAFIGAIGPAIASGIATGAAAGLGRYAIDKIIGDAPPTQQDLQLQQQQTQEQLPETQTVERYQPAQTTNTLLQSGPLPSQAISHSLGQLWTNYPLSYAQVDPSMILPQAMSQQGQAALAIQNSLSQSLSDAAALKANNYQLQPEARLLQMGALGPTTTGDVNLINSQQGIANAPYPMVQPALFYQPMPALNLGINNLARQNLNLAGMRIMPSNSYYGMPDQSKGVLVQASQPAFKLVNNQSTLVPAPDMEVPPAQSNITKPGESNSVRQNMNHLGTALKAGVTAGVENIANRALSQTGMAVGHLIDKGTAKVNSLLATGIASVVKKIIGDAPPAPSTYQNLLAFDLSKIDPQVMKIIGDAIASPNTFTTLHKTLQQPTNNETTKIVGDAPPKMLEAQPGMMTPEQVLAAQTNVASSPIFQLMARLIMEEQLLTQTSGWANGMNVIESNVQYTKLLTVASGSFSQAAIYTTDGFKGSAMTFTQPMEYRKVGGVWAWVHVTGNTRKAYTSASLVPAKNAPPLGGNVTLDSLKPLNLGAATTDYSNQLRVANTTTNIDAMMRLVSICAQNLMSASGYGFSLSLIKMLGYMLQKNWILGEGYNTFAAGTNFVFNQDATGNGQRRDNSIPYFPYHNLPSYTNISLRMAVLNERDYIDALAGGGNNPTWDQEFTPNNWGSTVAVVFVPTNSWTNHRLNMNRMIMQMGYPMFLTRYYTDWSWWVRMNNGQVNVQQNENLRTNWMSTKAGDTYIPGPTRNVLFVLIGNMSTATLAMTVGPQDDIIGLNTHDNGPNLPHIVQLVNGADVNSMIIWEAAFLHPSNMPNILALIREWETYYGNNSDRATALRFWADHGRLYGITPKVLNPITTGSVQGISGVVNTSIGDDQPNSPLYPPWLKSDTIHSENLEQYSTTASGLIPSYALFNTNETIVRVTDATKPTDVHTFISSEDYAVNYLVWKHWVYLMEEYPQASLADPSRITHSVTLMSNILAALTDLMYQSQAANYPLLYCPNIFADLQNPRLLLERKIWPAVEQLMQLGIQFPTSFCNRQSAFTAAGNLHNGHLGAVLGAAVLNGSIVTTVARIPRSLMGQWSISLLPIWNRLRLNLPPMKPSKASLNVEGLLQLLFQAMYCNDDMGIAVQDKAVVNNLVSRLSQGVVATGTSVNPGVILRNTRDQVIRYIAFSYRYPMEHIAQYICSSMGRNVSVPPTTNVGVPVIENIPDRDLVNGMDPFRLAITGPTDVFGPGEGSYSYVMYYLLSNGFSTITTTAYATVPDSVYTGDGVDEVMSYL